ncbi:adhesion G protein-coupled receptor E2-like [Salminus brasiliensis]|uniref:adhesion G protein-coupled receptor E2-like n=1 Tax=Salminus brasiliensis TaxID=930266 RepID=UPI003B8321A8
MRCTCLLFLGLLVLLIGEVSPATDCGPGYKTLKRKGPCVDANECEENQGICGYNSECTNTPGSYSCTCKDGFIPSKGEKIFTADQGVKCEDVSECTKHKDICGDNSECTNTPGSYYCICKDGFVSSNGKEIFTADQRVTCEDRDECEGNLVDCGRNAVCKNTMGSYYCTCEQGYRLRSGQSNFTEGDGVCEDVCIIHKSLCGEGDCKTVNDGYKCVCKPGFTNYGFKTMRCSRPNCKFLLENSTEQTSAELEQIVGELRSSCIEMRAGKLTRQVDGSKLLERLLDAIDKLLSAGPLNDNRKVTALLEITEKILKLLGPLLPNTTMSADHTEIQMLVRREAVSPQGKLSLSADGVQFDSHWETAAGDSYLEFTAASLLRYKSLETSVSGYFDWIEKRGEEKFQINSDVVTAVVTNNDTAQLKKPIQLTFTHLKPSDTNQTCVFWDSSLDGGAWSTRGCTEVMSNANQTVCSCTHLGSFAVLVSEKEEVLDLQLMTWLVLSLTLICLFVCLLTFRFVHSFQSPHPPAPLNEPPAPSRSSLIWVGVTQQGLPVTLRCFISAWNSSRHIQKLPVSTLSNGHSVACSLSMFSLLTMRRVCLLFLGLLVLLMGEVTPGTDCGPGYKAQGVNRLCVDYDECTKHKDICGVNSECTNTPGSYVCTCKDGFVSSNGKQIFTAYQRVTCEDANECEENQGICGVNSECTNTPGSYSCTCKDGFIPSNGEKMFKADQGVKCVDANECEDNQGICGVNSVCNNTPGSYYCTCKDGFILSNGKEIFTADQGFKCEDYDECKKHKDICGDNSECTNTVGSYFCTCKDGFVPSNGKEIFTADQGVTCGDRDECEGNLVDCGRNAVCKNTMGSYYCTCEQGYRLRSGQSNFTEGDGVCEDVCIIHKSLCGEGDCKTVNNDYECVCKPGFTNYGFKTMRCSKLNCEFLLENSTEQVWQDPEQTSAELEQIVEELRSSCIEMKEVNGGGLLERLLDAIDKLLSAGPLNDNRKVTALLEITEKILKLLGPLLPNITMSADHTEIQMLVRREVVPPQGKLSLSADGVQFDAHWETAAGDSYLGFTAASLLRYKSLETSVSGYFDWIEKRGEEKFQINSDVVTAVVTNNDTAQLKKPIQLTFTHLKSSDGKQTCVFWDSTLDGGAWSTRGCTVVMSNANQTVCSCTHLSSFAVLMSLYEKEDVFELQLITWIGLSVSLICLLICILTFCFVRSIQSTRTTIHLHLCISLFIADLVFLNGITRTENEVGCAFVAGLLHFFFLAAFCWMCLEGVQLFRMVVLVFHTTLRPLYLMAVGYGIPALIVAISAIANAKGYGTKRHCWLNLQDGFIWSFFGPVCLIIVVNIFFFLITVWKLAQKFSSLNQDLSKLHKIKSFTITAIAQLCVLGTMWIFGCFQFEEKSLVIDYIFTILNSLQGVLVFVMHCLFSKQVREEYAKILNIICTPQKRKYSFQANFRNNQTSTSQGSRSAHHTGEAPI